MKIIYATDIHYDITPEKPHYPYAIRNLKIFWDLLKEKMKTFDLFIGGGDLTVKGPACLEELAGFKEIVECITDRYIVTPGNHDLCPIKGMEKRYPGVEEYEYMELSETNFAKVFGDKGLLYSEMFSNVRLVAFAVRNEDPDNQLKRLEQELKKPGKKLVFSHYPVFQTRRGGFCSTWDYNRIRDVREKIAYLLAKPEHQVVCYFCGHQHINSTVPMTLKEDGTPQLELLENPKTMTGLQIETGAATQATCCYREIEVKNDRIFITLKQLPGINELAEGVMCADRSFDDAHTDVFSYHMGNEEERNIVIPL
jgi:calcineurin-like phosphoesterase family protein